MPELPEVETVRRGLAPAMEGRRVVRLTQNRADLRFPLPERFAQRVEGRRVVALRRRAKYLLMELEGGEHLLMHLGMSGRFSVLGPDPARPGLFHHATGTDPRHDHVVFDMEGNARVVFNDPRRFGFMEIVGNNALETCDRLKGLGPEPLSEGFTVAGLEAALTGKASPIKAALLDQGVVAGLGNIYVCEALFRAGVSPRRLAGSIPGARARRLHAMINAVIAEAIEAGGSTLRDFAHPDGSLGYFPNRFAVYDREGEPCPTCETPIRRLVQSGRSSFYCAGCQR
jgi:formamidopyrimidine-DNA glycosylase